MAFLNTDIPELAGSDTAICLGNLELLGARQSRLSEAVLAILSELANAILQDAGRDPDTVRSILLSLQSTTEDTADEVVSPAVSPTWRDSIAAVNRALMSRLSVHTGLYARLTLYRFLEERQPSPPSPTPGSSRPLDAAVGRIAYMSGAFADKAYARLSTCVPNARAAAFHSFVDACEDVHGGLCEYCLLPLENTQSGKLTAFSRLILRYGLSIVAVCDLENGISEGQFTRFALLRKAPDADAPLLPPMAGAVTPCYMELLYTAAPSAFSELLLAAEFCGLMLCRADTLPHIDESDAAVTVKSAMATSKMPDAPPICCVFDATHADMALFRRYLTLELPDSIVMGFYSTI